MKRIPQSRKIAAGFIVLTGLIALTAHPRVKAAESTPDGARVHIPAVFVENAGQFDPQVRFYSRAGRHAVFATDGGLTFAFEPAGREPLALRLTFLGASGRLEAEATGERPGRVNYLSGHDGNRTATSARTFDAVVYRDAWRGIDATVTPKAERLEYAFDVAAGADASEIRLRYEGATELSVGPEGDLRIHTPVGTLVDRAPRAWQQIDGRTVDVDARFVVLGGAAYGIRVGKYDRTRPLVIDPELVWASYLGSSGDDGGHAIALDAQGNIYVTGFTQWIDFPTTTGAFQTGLGGNDTNNPARDAFVTKVNPAGTALVYSTYLGGSGDDEGNAIAVDGSGNAYVTGTTGSADFPVTSGAFQTTPGSMFVTKVNPTGTGLVYSTYYSGSTLRAVANGIAVDSGGRAYVAGYAQGYAGQALPGASNGFQPSFGGDEDGFLVRLSPAGDAIEYGTFFGGGSADIANAIAVNGTDAYVTGTTVSFDFPTTTGALETSPALVPRTADGGSTWTIVQGLRTGSVLSFAVDPTSNSIVYAATDGQGVFKSTDEGVTFAPTGGGIPAGLTVYALTVVPSAPSTVYAATAAGVYKTLDGGASWAFSGLTDRLYDITVAPSTAAVFTVGQSAVYRSTDGGATWTTVLSSTSTYPGWGVVVDPSNSNVIYVGSYYGSVFKSTDGGTTWSQHATGSNAIIRNLRMDTSGALYVTAFGLYKSTNGGQSFAALPGFGTIQFSGVALDLSTSPATIWATAPINSGAGPVYRSTDGGNTTVQVPPRGDQINPNGLAVVAPGTLLVGATAQGKGWVAHVDTTASGSASLVYSTYLGGLGEADGMGIALDGSGETYVSGLASPDFPHTAGAAQAPPRGGGFVAKLNAAGSALVSSAGFLGQGTRVAIDSTGAAYVANGSSVGRLSPDASTYSSYTFGGSSGANTSSVVAGPNNTAYATGTTSATDFPTTSGAFQTYYGSGASDAFVAQVTFADVAGGGGGGGTLPSPWANQDIGAIGQPGSASYSNGVFTVAGAGGDIWGTNDAFEFVYQPLSGDGTLVARVTGEQNTSVFAKSGIMMRQSLGSGAADVILDVRPDGSVEFMDRSSTGGSTAFVAGSSQSFPAWLRLARSVNTVTASVSSDGTNWTTVGSVNVAFIGQIDVGLAVTSHDTSVTNSATFDNVSLTLPTSGGGLPSPWVSNDVGAVGIAGSTSFSNGTFTVKGSGADIWGTADAFQYASQSMGDGQIVARVASEQNTNTYAKAGVMLRETMDSGSANVMLDVKPDGGVEFMTRSTSGGATSFVAGASASLPASLKLVRAGSTVTGYVSADGSTWTTVGSTATSMAASANIGLIVTSHDDTVLNTSTFDNVSVTPATGALPAPWASSDVGAVGVAGTSSFGGGTFTVSGSGSDIWGTADAFQYAYQSFGDGQIVARVTGEQNTNTYAKAGVMLRETLDPGSAQVILDVKPGGGFEFLTRSAAGGETTVAGSGPTTFPMWLSLVRSGSSVTGYISNDGSTWNWIGSVTVSMAATANIGLAVTSHDNTVLNTATFDNVAITPTTP